MAAVTEALLASLMAQTGKPQEALDLCNAALQTLMGIGAVRETAIVQDCMAGVLREMGLPATALGWSLFSFNAGVEIGQLLVVVAVATLLGALRARHAWAGRQLVVAGSILVAAAGAYWFVQRVFFPGGLS